MPAKLRPAVAPRSIRRAAAPGRESARQRGGLAEQEAPYRHARRLDRDADCLRPHDAKRQRTGRDGHVALDGAIPAGYERLGRQLEVFVVDRGRLILDPPPSTRRLQTLESMVHASHCPPRRASSIAARIRSKGSARSHDAAIRWRSSTNWPPSGVPPPRWLPLADRECLPMRPGGDVAAVGPPNRGPRIARFGRRLAHAGFNQGDRRRDEFANREHRLAVGQHDKGNCF